MVRESGGKQNRSAGAAIDGRVKPGHDVVGGGVRDVVGDGVRDVVGGGVRDVVGDGVRDVVGDGVRAAGVP